MDAEIYEFNVEKLKAKSAAEDDKIRNDKVLLELRKDNEYKKGLADKYFKERQVQEALDKNNQWEMGQWEAAQHQDRLDKMGKNFRLSQRKVQRGKYKKELREAMSANERKAKDDADQRAHQAKLRDFRQQDEDRNQKLIDDKRAAEVKRAQEFEEKVRKDKEEKDAHEKKIKEYEDREKKRVEDAISDVRKMQISDKEKEKEINDIKDQAARDHTKRMKEFAEVEKRRADRWERELRRQKIQDASDINKEKEENRFNVSKFNKDMEGLIKSREEGDKKWKEEQLKDQQASYKAETEKKMAALNQQKLDADLAAGEKEKEDLRLANEKRKLQLEKEKEDLEKQKKENDRKLKELKNEDEPEAMKKLREQNEKLEKELKEKIIEDKALKAKQTLTDKIWKELIALYDMKEKNTSIAERTAAAESGIELLKMDKDASQEQIEAAVRNARARNISQNALNDGYDKRIGMLNSIIRELKQPVGFKDLDEISGTMIALNIRIEAQTKKNKDDTDIEEAKAAADDRAAELRAETEKSLKDTTAEFNRLDTEAKARDRKKRDDANDETRKKELDRLKEETKKLEERAKQLADNADEARVNTEFNATNQNLKDAETRAQARIKQQIEQSILNTAQAIKRNTDQDHLTLQQMYETLVDQLHGNRLAEVTREGYENLLAEFAQLEASNANVLETINITADKEYKPLLLQNNKKNTTLIKGIESLIKIYGGVVDEKKRESELMRIGEAGNQAAGQLGEMTRTILKVESKITDQVETIKKNFDENRKNQEADKKEVNKKFAAHQEKINNQETRIGEMGMEIEDVNKITKSNVAMIGKVINTSNQQRKEIDSLFDADVSRGESIGQLQTQFGSTQADLSKTQQTLGTLKTDLGGVNTKISGIEKSQENVLKDVYENKAAVESFGKDLRDVKTEIPGLKTGLSDVQGRFNVFEGSVEQMNRKIEDTNSAMAKVVENFNRSVRQSKDETDRLEERLKEIGLKGTAEGKVFMNEINNLKSEYVKLSDGFAIVEGRVINNATNQTASKLEVDKYTNDFKKFTEDVEKLSRQLNDAERNIKTLGTGLMEVETGARTMSRTFNEQVGELSRSQAKASGRIDEQEGKIKNALQMIGEVKDRDMLTDLQINQFIHEMAQMTKKAEDSGREMDIKDKRFMEDMRLSLQQQDLKTQDINRLLNAEIKKLNDLQDSQKKDLRRIEEEQQKQRREFNLSSKGRPEVLKRENIMPVEKIPIPVAQNQARPQPLEEQKVGSAPSFVQSLISMPATELYKAASIIPSQEKIEQPAVVESGSKSLANIDTFSGLVQALKDNQFKTSNTSLSKAQEKILSRGIENAIAISRDTGNLMPIRLGTIPPSNFKGVGDSVGAYNTRKQQIEFERTQSENRGSVTEQRPKMINMYARDPDASIPSRPKVSSASSVLDVIKTQASPLNQSMNIPATYTHIEPEIIERTNPVAVITEKIAEEERGLNGDTLAEDDPNGYAEAFAQSGVNDTSNFQPMYIPPEPDASGEVFGTGRVGIGSRTRNLGGNLTGNKSEYASYDEITNLIKQKYLKPEEKIVLEKELEKQEGQTIGELIENLAYIEEGEDKVPEKMEDEDYEKMTPEVFEVLVGKVKDKNKVANMRMAYEAAKKMGKNAATVFKAVTGGTIGERSRSKSRTEKQGYEKPPAKSFAKPERGASPMRKPSNTFKKDVVKASDENTRGAQNAVNALIRKNIGK
jgi:hypothetical protein